MNISFIMERWSTDILKKGVIVWPGELYHYEYIADGIFLKVVHRDSVS